MSPNGETSNSYGRVADDGTVYLITPDGERAVGSWQAGAPSEGLAHYMRRYDDLVTDVDLLAGRLRSKAAAPAQTLDSARRIAHSLPQAAVVGDIAALEIRLTAVIEQATNAALAASTAKKAVRQAALGAKEDLVTRAEQLADSTAWKQTSAQFVELLAQWKTAPVTDRATDRGLWKRYAAARDEFNKRRGAHFSALDTTRKAAAARKVELVDAAVALADSTQWQTTADKLKKLMVEWKELPRLAKDAEERLWNRFRAAQDAFFVQRSQALSQADEERRRRREQQEAARTQRSEQIKTDNPLLESMRQQVHRTQQQLERAHLTGNTSAIVELERALRGKQHILALAEGNNASANPKTD